MGYAARFGLDMLGSCAHQLFEITLTATLLLADCNARYKNPIRQNGFIVAYLQCALVDGQRSMELGAFDDPLIRVVHLRVPSYLHRCEGTSSCQQSISGLFGT